MSYSYFLDPSYAMNQFSYPTQATSFGMSSLAAASGSFLALDNGSQTQKLYPMTTGNNMTHNLSIVDTDKSPLGVEVRARMKSVGFTVRKSDTPTPPNVYSLSRDSLLF